MKKLKLFYHYLRIFFYFLFLPKFLFKIYQNAKLMSPKERIKFKEDVFKDFDIINEKKIFNEINVILRGESFSLNEIDKINQNIPTFVINPNFNHLSMKIDNIFLLTSDGGIFEQFEKHNLPIYYIAGGININGQTEYREFNIDPLKTYLYKNNKFKSVSSFLLKNYKNLKVNHLSKTYNLQLGSSLICIFFLANLSKKINIYGWDIYIKTKPKYPKNLFYMIHLLFSHSGTYRYNIHGNFASSLFNTYYAYRLNLLNNININGHITYFFKNKLILNKIKQIIYTK